MIPNVYLHIKTERFQKETDEDAGLVNPGMYGSELAKFIQNALVKIGYTVPYYCNEDWGWWVEIKGFPHLMGLCIYGRSEEDGVIREYVICSGVTDNVAWSWRKFKRVNTVIVVNKLMDDTENILKNTDGVSSAIRENDMPW